MNRKLLNIVGMAVALCGFHAVQAGQVQYGADRHAARGVTCQMCHGADMKSPEFPEEPVCVRCHNKAQVAQKTKQMNPNPHNAPHNGECTLCHVQHGPSADYCGQCHTFKYKPR